MYFETFGLFSWRYFLKWIVYFFFFFFEWLVEFNFPSYTLCVIWAFHCVILVYYNVIRVTTEIRWKYWVFSADTMLLRFFSLALGKSSIASLGRCCFLSHWREIYGCVLEQPGLEFTSKACSHSFSVGFIYYALEIFMLSAL